MFLDIRAFFDSADRSTLWQYLLRNGVSEKYASVLKELYRHKSGRVRAYGQLSLPFFVSSGVRQGYPISPFLFNFVIENFLDGALSGLSNGGLNSAQDTEIAT